MAQHLMQVNIRDSDPPRTLRTEPYICLHLLRILYPIPFKFQPLLTAGIEKMARSTAYLYGVSVRLTHRIYDRLDVHT
jgi:hypothetical protein